MGDMRKNPFIVLVCLLFIAICPNVHSANSGSFIKIIIDNETTGADSGSLAFARQAVAEPQKAEAALIPAAASRLPGLPTGSLSGSFKPIVKCKTGVCEVAPVCLPEPVPPCILPHRNCGQWELSVQAFFARVLGRITWPYARTVDFNDDLGLDSHKVLFEYSARYQFRPNWAIIYSIMPIDMEANYTSPLFPGFVYKSKWQTVYQRVGLIYDAVRTCSGAISVYSSWLLFDQKLAMDDRGPCVTSGTCTIQRTKNMVISGIEFQKCIRTMCNGGSLSCDNKAGVAYLDGSVGIDVQTGLQYSVPLNCGRYGYAKGGYRVIDFWEDRYDRRIDTLLNGWFAEMGLVF
jgi:hypothetical protein